MALNYLLERLRDEWALLRYSLKMLIGRNLLAVGIISVVLLVLVFTHTFLPWAGTRESVLLSQLELFAPLLGIVVFSDLIATEFETRRAELLRSSRSGISSVVIRKLIHGVFFTAGACLMVLLILRVFYTSFKVLPALGIIVPGSLYFGMIGLLAATAARKSLAGYAVGTAAWIITLTVEQVVPLGIESFSSRSRLARLANFRFLGEENWLIAKIYFVVMAFVLCWVVLRIACDPGRRNRLVIAAGTLLLICYTGAHALWTRPGPLRPQLELPGEVLDVREQDGALLIRTATTRLFWHGDQKHEDTSVQEIRYRRDDNRWVKEEERPFELFTELDLLHVDVDAAVAPASGGLDATAAMRLRVRSNQMDRMYFRIAWELQVDRVSVDGRRAEFKKFGDLVEVSLPSPVEKGEPLSVEVSYQGHLKLPHWRRGSEGFDEDYLIVASRWFPHTKDWYHEGPEDLFTCRVVVRVPVGYTVASADSVGTEDGHVSYQWTSDVPVEEIPLCVGRFRQARGRYRDIPITVNTFTVGKEYAERIVKRCADVLRIHEEAYGPYPYRQLSIMEDRFQGAGGHALPSMVTIKTERWRPEHRRDVLDGYLPHEIAHLWWSTGLPSWIAEAVAVFSNFRYLERTSGRADATAYMDRTLYEMFLQKRYGGGPRPLTEDRGASMYAKGGYLLIMLKAHLGEDRILTALKDFYEGHKNRSFADREATTEDFVQTLRDAAGQELHPFLSDWIRTVKTYDPAVTALQQEKWDEGYNVVALLEHRGEIRFPVPVRIVLKDGSHQDTLWSASAVEDTLEWMFDQPVRSAVIDPEHVLLDWDRGNNRAFPSSPVQTVPALVTGRFEGWRTYTQSDGLVSNDVRCLFVDDGHRIYVGLYAPRLRKSMGWACNWFDGKWHRFDVTTNTFAMVTSIARSVDGTLWTGGSGKIRRLQNDKANDYILKETRHYRSWRIGEARFRPNPETNSNIPGSRVYALVSDADGRLWVGTDHGISVLDYKTQEWRHFSRRDGLPGDEVLALAQDSSGKVWAGTDRGVASYRGRAWTMHPECGADLILSAVSDRKGTVWLGTYRGGVVAFDGVHTRHYTSENSPLPHNLVPSLTVDAQDRLWVGTLEGLACFDGKTWRVFTTEDSRLPSNQIRTLIVDGEDRLWIGTNVGVTRYDLALYAGK